MKRGVLKGLGLTILGSVHLFGCATEDAAECLPGDIECADDLGGDGKADGYDYKNDPARMSQHLTYKLADLPKVGKLTTPVWKQQYPQATSPVAWADTYWPTAEGSHNARWQGRSVKSPLEKYDAAFNNAQGCETQPASVCGAGAKAAWDTYNNCAGPAAKWQSNTFQNAARMHDGIDNNNDGKKDECNGSNGNDGVASWWGTCHAWSPAALLAPEPQHAVTVNGVTFDVGDIKALIQNAYDSTSSVMLGGRCNSQKIEHDVRGSANDACADVNAGSLHIVLTNFLGIAQLPLVEDRTANYEVWNQPVLGYEVTYQEEVSASKANQCVGRGDGSRWKYNRDAKKLVEVRVTIDYLVEGNASNHPLGFANNTSQDDYHYILELNNDGKVIGGRYCTDSTNDHIDFLWSPTGTHRPTNPHVDLAKVQEIIAKSVAPEGSSGGASGGSAREFSAAPHATIPDNDPAGVTVDVPVTGLAGALGLAVSVDIAHTYRGDLVVTLLKDGAVKKTLHDQVGGGEDNLVQTYTLSASEVGADANGRWQLKVVDTASEDTGSVNSVKLSFQ
ncbi:MAG: proprotein convertase P-domain-containing protein [Kofleriaceae bacterium]|nr:proprotein convertase P-domain-containing protein [Kofleriaceae bacterium]